MRRSDRRTFLSRAAVACIAPSALAACIGQDTTPITTSYRTAVELLLAQYRIPGALVSLRRPGNPEWKEAFGYADVASKTRIEPNSHFPIRSITKSFVVTLQLMLAADRLDRPIAAYFPDVPGGETITFADLAGMQSGIADYTASKKFLADFTPDFGRAFTEQELVDYAIPGSPKFAAGAQYDYCNTNTVLLGMFVPMIASGTIASILQRLILDPLGMRDTAYPNVVPLPFPHATPYSVNVGTGALQVFPLVNPTAFAGSGAMISTLDDLQTWAGALGDGRLLGPQLQALRIQRSRAVTSGPRYDRYGLGIGILKGWLGHTGDGIGWQAAAFYDPVTRTTIAVSVNATPDVPPPRPYLNFAEEIFAALADLVTE